MQAWLLYSCCEIKPGTLYKVYCQANCGCLLVFLCVHATAAAAILAVHSCCKAVTVQLEALGLLAIAPLGTTASQAPSLYALQQSHQCQLFSKQFLQ